MRISISLATLVVLFADVAAAQTVVVYGGDGPGEAAVAAARAAAGDPSAAALYVDDVFAGVGAGPRLYGAYERVSCDGDPISSLAMQRLLDQCRQAIQDLTLEGAAEVFDLAMAAVPCAVEVIPPQTLTDLFFYRGLLDVYDGRPDQADLHFRQALAIKPDRRWDPAYPPEAFQVYLEAMEQHYLSARIEVPALLDQSSDALALFDGVALTSDTTAVDLAQGDHLLQVQAAAGAVTTVQFRVVGGETLLLASDAAIGGLILEGPRAPRHGWAAAERLGELARRLGADRVLVVAGRSVHRYSPATGLFDVVREPLDRHTRAYRAGVALSIAGTAVATIGAVVAGTSYGRSPRSTADPDYPAYFRAHNAGWGLIAGGGAMAAIGVPLGLSNRPSRMTTVSCTADAGGLRLGLGGAW